MARHCRAEGSLSISFSNYPLEFAIVSSSLRMLAGGKRSHSGSMLETSRDMSQFTSMFETFRSELDEHYDRRERIVKASRDITAASKKM